MRGGRIEIMIQADFSPRDREIGLAICLEIKFSSEKREANGLSHVRKLV